MISKIHLTGNLSPFTQGLEILLPEFGVNLSDDGFPVSVVQGDCLSVELCSQNCTIIYHRPIEFYRALSLLIQNFDKKKICIREQASFESNGIMFDCSRNAVLTVDTLKFFLRKMAFMGLNLAMMYTEDTFTMKEHAYFGYCRGRYSFEELKELDDYAFALGIEMVPCIQTLSHLDRVLRWPEAEPLRDTSNTLLTGSDETYAFIEEMLVSASAPYRSKRIHIGMDEAFDLGDGIYRQKNGYIERYQIMAEHLSRVNALLIKHELIAMMWSDMHFFNETGTGCYNPICKLSEKVVDSAPENIALVYWDYYHDTEDSYDRMLNLHKQFKAETIFAGGIWTWTGPVADYRKTLAATIPALTQCIKHGVKQVFATAWGDNGAEANLLTILYGLQLFAEIDYTQSYDACETMERFKFCVGADAQAFLDISLLNEIPGVKLKAQGTINPTKQLLYEDPLLPLFEKDFEGIDTLSHYTALGEKFRRYQEENSMFSKLFEFYAVLCDTLANKSRWRNLAADCVRSKNRMLASSLSDLAQENIQSLRTLKAVWESLWFSTNKPFGFEIIDQRLGGIMARFESAGARMSAFAAGTLDDIPELSCEKLPYIKNSDGEFECLNAWHDIISACKISG